MINTIPASEQQISDNDDQNSDPECREELLDQMQPLDTNPSIPIQQSLANLHHNKNMYQRVILRKESILSQAGSHRNTDPELPPIPEQPRNSSQRPSRRKSFIKKKESITIKQVPVSKWVIMPNNVVKTIWDIIQILFLFYSGIFTPYKIAFINDGDYPFWDTWDDSVNYVFITDIVLTYFTAYYNEDSQIVSNLKEIQINYVKGWFCFDLISSFPFNLIINITATKYNSIARFSKLPKLYRLVRMIKLARVIKFKDFKYISLVYISTGMERIMLSFFIMLFSCHIAGCLFFLFAGISDEDSWYILYQDNTAYEQYVVSLYWTIQSVLTVGFGDVQINSWSGRLFSIIWMIISVYIFSLTVGSLASFLERVDQANQRYMARFATMKKIHQEFQLPLKLFNKVKRELRNNQISQSAFNQQIEDLPNNLKVELGLIMYRHLIDEIEYFQDKPSNFISAIGPLLTPLNVLAHEYLFMTGDAAEEMFFIKEGKVAAVIPQYNNFKFILVRSGSYFGEIDLLFYGELRKYTIRTTKLCEFYVLSKKHFRMIFLNNFREIGFQMIKQAQIKKEQLKQSYAEAITFCEKNQEEEDSASRRSVRKQSKFFTQKFQKSITSVRSKNGSELYSDSNDATPLKHINTIKEANEDEEQEHETETMLKFLDQETYLKKIHKLEQQVAYKDKIIHQIQSELDQLFMSIQKSQPKLQIEDPLIPQTLFSEPDSIQPGISGFQYENLDSENLLQKKRQQVVESKFKQFHQFQKFKSSQ